MNRQFAALRGLAIVLVVLNHAVRLSDEAAREIGLVPVQGVERAPLALMAALGVFAVPTFLFISGSFFSYAAQGKNARLSWRTVRAALAHLLPPYLFWSIVFYVLIYFEQGKSFTAAGYVKNLLVGYPYAFVPLIAFYYVAALVLVPLIRRYSWLIIAVVGAYQVVLMLVVRPGLLGPPLPEWTAWLAPPVLRSTLSLWAIYFPLGMIFSLNSRAVAPVLLRWRRALWALTGALFVLTAGHEAGLIWFPAAQFLAPLAFTGTLPSIQRQSIPLFRELEEIGRKSYGLYLTNLVVLTMVLTLIQAFAPWALTMQNLVVPGLFCLTLAIPVLFMAWLERLPIRRAYPFVFG